MKRIVLFWCLMAVAVTTMAQSDDEMEAQWRFAKGKAELMKNNYGEAVECFTYVIETDLESAYAYQLRGITYYYMDENGKALSDLNKSLMLLPKKDKASLADSYKTRGDIMVEIGDTISALQDYDKALKLYPKFANAYFSRGKIYGMKRMYKEAEADFRHSIKLRSDHVESYLYLAMTLNVQERYDETVGLMDRLIAMYKDLSYAYVFRGEAYVGKKQWTDAVRDILAALRMEFNSRAMDVLNYSDGELYQCFEKVLKIRVYENPFWHFLLGQLYTAHGRYDEAITSFELLQQNDEDAFALHLMSYCYDQLGQYDRAVECSERAVKLDPEAENYAAWLDELKSRRPVTENDVK